MDNNQAGSRRVGCIKRSRPAIGGTGRSQNCRGNTALDPVPAVVFFTVNRPAGHSLILAELPSFPGGYHSVSAGHLYIPADVSLLQGKAPGFSTGKLTASYSFPDTVAVHSAARLCLSNIDPEHKYQYGCYQ